MRWLIVALIVLSAPAAWAQSADNPLHVAVLDYARYQADVSALIEAPIDSQAALDSALIRASRHDPSNLTSGWLAYGALGAAQSPAFVRGLRHRVRAAGRAPVIRQLVRDLGYARRRPPGSAEAIGLILASARADAGRLETAGGRYVALARTIEAAGWDALSSDARTDRTRRLRAPGAFVVSDLAQRVRVSVLESAPLTEPRSFGGAAFWDALAEHPSAPAPADAPRAAPAHAASVDRMLTLAGLFIVGAAQEQPARVSALLDDPPTRQCLELELLQFRQCASVAHAGDEDALCLARHGLARPAACFASIMR